MAMGYIAGKEAASRAKRLDVPGIDEGQAEAICTEAQAPLKREDGIRPIEVKRNIRKLMSSYMLFDRKEEELKTGIKELERMRNDMLPGIWVSAKTRIFNLEWVEAFEARNMLDVAEMAMRSALMRTESRGLHERADYPDERPEWLKLIILSKMGNDMKFTTEPTVFSYVKPPES